MSTTFTDLIRIARGDKILIGDIEAYCRNALCPVRYVRLDFKEYDTEMPDTLKCPACRGKLSFHWYGPYGKERIQCN